jgi:hypothetical protein
MLFLVYGIGFVICYFLIGFNWWMSLLIALAFPAALGIAMDVIGVPLLGIITGIGAVISKIKRRRQERHSEPTWENVSEPIEPQEREMPLVTRAEYFQDHIQESTSEPQMRVPQPNLLTTAEIEKKRKEKSNTFGIWSLVLGIIGVFWWPEAFGVAAVVLGVLQFRRHINKRAIAGFTLGVVDIVLAVVFHLLGLYPFGI